MQSPNVAAAATHSPTPEMPTHPAITHADNRTIRGAMRTTACAHLCRAGVPRDVELVGVTDAMKAGETTRSAGPSSASPRA